jgi:hypothetical protein
MIRAPNLEAGWQGAGKERLVAWEGGRLR